MTEYWKSQPRRFCEICKCWFGDNKAVGEFPTLKHFGSEKFHLLACLQSIQHHEQGVRHKNNVQKRIKEV